MPKGGAQLGRVISLLNKPQAWSLKLLRKNGAVKMPGGTVLKWEQGQNSALDIEFIHQGKEVLYVISQKNGVDVSYFVYFAFPFHAF